MSTRRFHHQHGSALISSAISAAILSLLAAGTLSYMSNEFSLNFRAHHWNQSLHLAEAGVELGFAEINYQYFRDADGFRTDRGWTSLGGGSYSRTVSNFNNAGNLQITVTGVGSSYPQILGDATIPDAARGPSLTRAVRVRLAPSSSFPMGLVAKEEIDLNGNRIYTDSFDSSDPSKSTGGAYDYAKRQPNGDIATNGELVDQINIGNADIYGSVHTGPGGSVAIGPGGSVGTTFVEGDRATTTNAAETASWITHDFSTDIPDVTLPDGLASAFVVGTINTTTTLSSGDWQADAIQLNASKTLTIDGTVRLYVTGDINITGSSAAIIIAPGGSLEIYAAGSVSIAGGGVVNNTGAAVNNRFYGLPSSTSWTIGGNGQWVGTVYAPQADLTLNGGGASGDMSGGIVSASITLNGQVQFHYDESLRSDPEVVSGYIVVSWQSLCLLDGDWAAE